jgi:hypothetical protein
MAELTVDNLFDKAMDATSTGLKAAGFATTEPWVKLMPALRKAVGTTFEPAGRSSLSSLRRAVEASEKVGKKEGDFLAAGAGVTSKATITADEAKRSGALKLLRHTYYHARRDNHKMWIVSLPNSYSQWPHTYLAGATPAQLIDRLDADGERFSADDRKHMSDATLRGLRWIHSALILIDDLKAGSRGLRVLKRWFADEDTTDAQLRTFATTTLKNGLKKMASKMSAGHLIIVDFVPIRHSADAGDQGFVKANAFVWADTRDVIYIEPPFFTRNGRAVMQSDAKHWSRIMVHEMSHREANTEDERYAHSGIKPVKGSLSSAQCMNNADSWAIFCANAANYLSRAEINRCLNGT